MHLRNINHDRSNKAMIEVVGPDAEPDYAAPNSVLRHGIQHELEGKLILSSDLKGWNISENFIVERNLGHDPYEFGYAAGACRPVALAASPRWCNFCAENFLVGAEFYGGLGTTWDLSTSGTSHYGAAILGW